MDAQIHSPFSGYTREHLSTTKQTVQSEQSVTTKPEPTSPLAKLEQVNLAPTQKNFGHVMKSSLLSLSQAPMPLSNQGNPVEGFQS